MTKKKYTLYIAIFIFYFGMTLFVQKQHVQAAYLFDPDLTWKTIKTKHFWIHYHQGLGHVAQKMTTIAEKVHSYLIIKTAWEPEHRTHIVLVDNTDMANGFAIHLPRNRVQLYLSRPELNSSLNNFDNWLELVFLHEYTHILNLDTSRGVPGCMRKILGRHPLLFPNTFVPIWVLEGNAVYHESAQSRFGRNNSTFTDMVLRTEVANDSLKPISKASFFPREWPQGQVPYLYGGSFVKYLENTHGEDTFAFYFHENGDNIIPFSDSLYFFIPYFYNKDAKDIYQKSFGSLWKEWQTHTTAEYKKQINRLRSQGLSNYRIISNKKNNSTLPRFSPDGRRLYYVTSSPYNGTSLMTRKVQPAKRTNPTRLATVFYPNSLTVAADNNIVLSDVQVKNNYSIYNDVYAYNTSADDYFRKTNGLRAKHIDYSLKRNQYIYIINTKDTFSLVLSDHSFQNTEYVIKNSPVQIAFPRFSADGNSVVFSIKDNQGKTDLALYNLNNKSMLRLTNDPANDIQPSWHPDGKKIVFSSDRNGVYNIHELDLKTATIRQISNLIGGGFSPQVSPNGKHIVFESYQKNGHSIALMTYPEKTFRTYSTASTRLPGDYFKPVLKEKIPGQYKPENYSVTNSLFPSFYIPLLPLFASEQYTDDKYDGIIGVITAGSDILFHHLYSIIAYTTIEQKRSTLYFNYMFARYNPNILLTYFDNTLQYGKDKYPWDQDEAINRTLYRYGSLGVDIPFQYIDKSLLLNFSYIYGREYTKDFNFYDGVISSEEKISDIAALFAFSNTKSYIYSVIPENGREILLGSQYLNESIGASNTYYILKGRYTEYLPFIFNNNVLKLNLRGGHTNKDIDNDMFDLGRFNNGDLAFLSQDIYDFGLRGFPVEAAKGDNIANASVELTIPLIQYDFAVSIFPLMFRDLWLTAFFDYGNVWNGEPDFDSFQYSTGAELHATFTGGYQLDINTYAGFAKGLSSQGEEQFYFAIGTQLSDLLNQKRNKLIKKQRTPLYRQTLIIPH